MLGKLAVADSCFQVSAAGGGGLGRSLNRYVFAVRTRCQNWYGDIALQYHAVREQLFD
jgi:hypothetical protein